MRSRQRTGERAAIFAAILAAALLGGCQSGSPPPDDSNEPDDGSNTTFDEQAVMNAPNLDAWFEAVSRRPPGYDPSPAVTTSRLIEEAHRSGELTDEECYVARLQAAFDPDALDERFRGEPDGMRDNTCLLREVRRDFDSMSSATQSLVEPYLLSFDDPDSFWHLEDEPRGEDVMAKAPPARTFRDMERPAGDAYFIITAPPGVGEDARDIVREALYYAYDRFVDIGFPEPTDWIRISLREGLLASDRYGEQFMADLAGHERCHILLELWLDDDTLRSTAAHELFHCFQDYVEDEVGIQYGPWVWESTAVWSEELVYPDLNTEHEYDEDFFGSLAEFLFDASGTLEYGSYMFWFFLYQRAEKTGDIVRQYYEDIHALGTVETIGGQEGFHELFKEYALWNLNSEPYKYYEDFGDMPVLMPHGFSIDREHITPDGVLYQEVFASEGGITYYAYTFDDLVSRVEFDLHEVTSRGDHVGVQMLYRIDRQWEYQDVSNREEIVFCRTRAAEAVDAVILIVSNAALDISDPDSLLTAQMTVDGTEWCLPSWNGFVECSSSASGPGDGRGSDDLLDPGNYTSHSRTRVNATLVHDDVSGDFYATQRTASISSQYRWFWQHPISSFADTFGQTVWEQRIENKHASRTYNYESDGHCPPDCDGLPRMIRRLEDQDNVYRLNDSSYSDVGTYISRYASYYVPGSLGLMQGHVAEIRTTEDEHDINIYCPSDYFDLTMSDDGLTLTGSYSDGNTSCTAEFRYE